MTQASYMLSRRPVWEASEEVHIHRSQSNWEKDTETHVSTWRIAVGIVVGVLAVVDVLMGAS